MLTTIGRQKSSGSSRTVKTKGAPLIGTIKKFLYMKLEESTKKGFIWYSVVCALNTDCIDKMPSNVLCDSL